jgi:N-formylglutamate amidohydrolase
MRRLPHTLAALLLACGVSSSPVDDGHGTPTEIMVVGGDDQSGTAGIALAIDPLVVVRDDAGRPVGGVTVNFAVSAGDGWVADASVTTLANGQATTTWYLGPQPATSQRLRASAGTGLAVEFTATADPLEPTVTYYGSESYVELTVGDLPLIITAPHGGTLKPAAVPDRNAPGATVVRDFNTDLLARAIAEVFRERTSSAPHIVIVNLHREKLDANRDLEEAAEGNRGAERAWYEYHGFIEAARRHVLAAHEHAFYIDLHGHGHEIQRLELGYLLSAANLQLDDASLNAATLAQRSSIRHLAETGTSTHAELIRGPHSLGTLFEQHGFPAVPSTAQPYPEPGEPYFTGGYNTARYSSRNGGRMDGVQIEANRVGVRNTAAEHRAFASGLLDVLDAWFEEHYGASLVPAAAAATR